MRFYFLSLTLISAIVFAACQNNQQQSDNTSSTEPAPTLINYTVLNAHKHDTSFYTEGLEFNDGRLFESSGGFIDTSAAQETTPHPSAFGIADPMTGKIDKKIVLDNKVYFGEGITFFNGKIYQLTWKNQKGFVYDAKTFRKLKEFNYQGEGWGLTHDSSWLIMSDGSSNLRFLNPETLKVETIVSVVDNNGPVSNINELEYIDGFIYANVWQRDHIIKIDPVSGKVLGKINLDSIVREIRTKSETADYLNGIAYNPATKTIFVTGKLWPLVYEIRLN